MSPHFKIILDECTRDGSLKALGASNAINIPLDTLGAAIEMSDADFKVSSRDTFLGYDSYRMNHTLTQDLSLKYIVIIYLVEHLWFGKILKGDKVGCSL